MRYLPSHLLQIGAEGLVRPRTQINVQRFADVWERGVELDAHFLLGGINIFERLFLQGFQIFRSALFREEPLRYPDMSLPILGYFALRLRSEIQLPLHLPEGLYQIGVLARDGVIVRLHHPEVQLVETRLENLPALPHAPQLEGSRLNSERASLEGPAHRLPSPLPTNHRQLTLRHDGIHPMQLACTNQPILLSPYRAVRLRIDWFRGPPDTLGLILLLRPWQPQGLRDDRYCIGEHAGSVFAELETDGYFFSRGPSNQPQTPFLQLIGDPLTLRPDGSPERGLGWKLVSPDFLRFPSHAPDFAAVLELRRRHHRLR